MRVPLLVLNYNGRRLLEQCLPSLVRAAAASRHECRVVVIDNNSTDESLAYLQTAWPEIEVISRPNEGLCSYNAVLADMATKGQEGPVAVLLNNDIKLDADSLDPLIEPLLAEGADRPGCWMTAPLCWRFDGVTYDGQKTAVRWRHGLVQATSMFPGHEQGIKVPGWTASAGAAMAVQQRVFLELGGFDPLYLPGRLEDLDLSYRAWLAGYRARHVPTAVAYHLGMGSFSRAFSMADCDLLTLRNTLLFQWKNLRHPANLLRQIVGLPLRLLRELWLSPFKSAEARWIFCRALLAAWQRRSQLFAHRVPHPSIAAEAEFFQRFHASRMLSNNEEPVTNRGEIESNQFVPVTAAQVLSRVDGHKPEAIQQLPG